MSTTTSDAPDTHLAEDEQHHPSERIYWIVAAVLAVVTAIEVALSYVELGDGTSNAALLLLGMIIKFLLVGGFFMHLKFDKPILRNLFIGGLFLALGCYIAEMSTFRQFGTRDSRQDIHLVPSGIPQADPRP